MEKIRKTKEKQLMPCEVHSGGILNLKVEAGGRVDVYYQGELYEIDLSTFSKRVRWLFTGKWTPKLREGCKS